MSSVKEGHDETLGVSVKADHENEESGAKAEPELTADNNNNPAIPEKTAELNSEPSENEGEEEEKEREEDYDEEGEDEEGEASGSDYDDGKSPYSARKESEGKNPRGGSRAAKPKRKYKKPRQRHRTDDSQLKRLEEVYQYDSNPNHEMRVELAKESGMSTRQIQVWFQNRRAKTRRDAAREQLKVRVNAVGRPPLDRSRSVVGPEGPSGTVAPPQDKQPKEPNKKRSYTKRKKGADNNGHGHHKHGEDDEKDNGDDGPKSHHYLRHKKVRVGDEYDSSSSELSSESSYSEGESSSSSSSDSYSSSESSSSDIPENDSYALQSEFSNPSYLYKKVLEYIKRNGKIDQQESEEQDLKRLFG